MKRILLTVATGAALSLASIVWVSPALAEECHYHNVNFDLELAEEMEQPDPFDECWFLPKVVGTLNGQAISCSYDGDFFTSDELWDDGLNDYQIVKYYGVIETSKGEVSYENREVQVSAGGLAGGLVEVTGGTGAYQGATGTLRLDTNADLHRAELKGEICTP